MNNDKNQSSNCPTFEDLSALHDCEHNDQSLHQHVATCDECQQVVAEFEYIDDLIDKSFRVDADIVLRIRDNCLSEINKSRKDTRIFTFPTWIKVAACLLLVGVTLVLREKTNSIENANTVVSESTFPIRNENASEKSISDVVVQGKEHDLGSEPVADKKKGMMPDHHGENQTGKSIVAAQSAGSLQGPMVRLVEQNIPHGKLDLSDINLVGYGLNQAYAPQRTQPKPYKRTKGIQNYVHHVWVVDNPVGPLKELKSMLPNHISVLEKLINQDQSRYHLQFRIMDTNLKNLVDHFDGLGYTLLSPDVPQPGANDTLSFAGKKVQYNVDFVRK